MNEELENEELELEEEIQEPEQEEEEELDELAPEDIAPIPVPEGGRFHIQTEDHLNWYVKKYIQKKNAIATVKAMAKIKIDEAKADLERFEKRHKEDAKLVSTSLLPKGKKTLKLWNGVISFRSVNPTIEILDPEKIPTKYKETQLIKKIVIDKETLKSEMFLTGEVIDGAQFVDGYESMNIKEPKK